ncbi:hypothetical protein [Streptomyces decoyicus]
MVRTPGTTAAPTEATAPKAPSEASAPEPSVAGAVTAVVIVLSLTLTGMVAQLFPEPQGDRTADTE